MEIWLEILLFSIAIGGLITWLIFVGIMVINFFDKYFT